MASGVFSRLPPLTLVESVHQHRGFSTRQFFALYLGTVEEAKKAVGLFDTLGNPLVYSTLATTHGNAAIARKGG